MVENKKDRKIIANTLITLIIVAMLILSGPAQAVQVSMNAADLNNRLVGEQGFFYINVTIGANERIPIANISVENLPDISGSPGGKLVFNVTDINSVGVSVIKGNYTITLIDRYGWVGGTNNVSGNASNYLSPPYYGYGYGYQFTGYGYGYGYGYGGGNPSTFTRLNYKVTVDTTGAIAGTYNAQAKVNTGQGVVFQGSSSFILKPITMPGVIPATLRITPRTLNLNSNGEFTARIQLASRNVTEINESTIVIEGAHTIKWNIAGNTLIAKFNTQDLANVALGDAVKFTVKGNLTDGTPFEGNDTIKVIARSDQSEFELDLLINDTGYVNNDVNIPTPNANIGLTIPAGTRATLNGVPISNTTSIINASFNATLETAASNSNFKFIGYNLTLLPAGAVFDPYILIRINYSKADIPDGVKEDDLNVYWYNGATGKWEMQERDDLNKAKNYIIVRVRHFSTFALLGSVTPTTPPSGGGGGGDGSGGGVVSGEPFDNIEKGESKEKDLIANRPVTYPFTPEEGGIYEIDVIGEENENDIMLRVEHLNGLSKLLKEPAPGKVYYYVNVWSGTKKIQKALVRFKVERSWLNSNGIASDELKMLKWDGSKWIKLATTQKSKDATHEYFEAETDTFSHFAVVGLKEGELPVTTPAVTPTVSTPGEIATGTPTPAAMPPEAPPVNLAVIAGLIVLIGLGTVVYIKRKKIFKK